MKVLAALLAAVACAVVAEPPLDRSYLPPSSQYGPPSPGMEYGAPPPPSSQYGAPSAGATAFGRSSVAPAARVSSSFGAASSSRFGAGRRFGTGAAGLSSRYGAPSAFGRSSGFGGLGVSSQYGAPSFTSSSGALSTQYSDPSSSSYSSAAGAGSLSTQYGAPAVDSGFGRNAAPSPVYGVPGYGYGRAGAQEDALAEPANYQFSYSVQDANTLSDFGHDEARQDESAQGEYRVLLPDGRKQIVSYQADENGYRPTIEYVDTGITANSAGGYNYGRGGSGSGNGGYHY